MMETPTHEAILAVVRPSEQLLWSGRPGRIFKDADFVIFGVWSLVISVCMMRMFDGRSPTILPFVLVGLAFLLGCAVVVAYRRTHLIYGVTNRRVLFVRTGFFGNHDTYELVGMTESNVLLEHVNGNWGTIGFKDFAKWCGYDNDELCMPEFRAIPDAVWVAGIIRSAITDSRQQDKRWEVDT